MLLSTSGFEGCRLEGYIRLGASTQIVNGALHLPHDYSAYASEKNYMCGSKATPHKRNRAAGVRKHGGPASLSRKAGIGRQPYNAGFTRVFVSEPLCRGVARETPHNIFHLKKIYVKMSLWSPVWPRKATYKKIIYKKI